MSLSGIDRLAPARAPAAPRSPLNLADPATFDEWIRLSPCDLRTLQEYAAKPDPQLMPCLGQCGRFARRQSNYCSTCWPRQVSLPRAP